MKTWTKKFITIFAILAGFSLVANETVVISPDAVTKDTKYTAIITYDGVVVEQNEVITQPASNINALMAKPVIETAQGVMFYPEEIDLIEVQAQSSKWWTRAWNYMTQDRAPRENDRAPRENERAPRENE